AQGAVDWLVASANGNPLALIELPRGLTPEQVNGQEALSATVPPATTVEKAYLDQLVALPDEVRWLLLLAAAEDVGDLGTVTRAAAELDVNTAALELAELEVLLPFDHVRFYFRYA